MMHESDLASGMPDAVEEVMEPPAKKSFMDGVKKASSGGKFVTIFGDPGVGKTSVAQHCLPSPFFVPVENGLLSVPDAVSLGVPKSLNETFNQMFSISAAHRRGDFPFRTVVIDSITHFEVFATEHVLAETGCTTLEEVGKFAAGKKAVAAQMTRLRAGCQHLTDIGLNVAVIAHATTITEKPADMEDYTIWTLDVEERGRSQWISNADAVIHVRIPTATTEQGKRHVARASGDPLARTLGVVSGPSTIAKNRFRCTTDLEFVMQPDGTFTNPIESAFADLT